MAKRKIICTDAVEWLSKHRDLGSVITSLPELEEVSMSEVDYKMWFVQAASECFKSTSEGHLTIFYQTDRLYKSRRISKAYMLMKAAQVVSGHEMIWHKIVLRRAPGKIDLRRPGFSHLIAFGDEKAKAGKATPDVFDAGGMLYPNGMGLQAATVALQAALKHGPRVCDPFCGRGTVPVLAEHLGFTQIVGVDIDEAQCEAAKSLRLAKVDASFGKPTKKRMRLFE